MTTSNCSFRSMMILMLAAFTAIVSAQVYAGANGSGGGDVRYCYEGNFIVRHVHAGDVRVNLADISDHELPPFFIGQNQFLTDIGSVSDIPHLDGLVSNILKYMEQAKPSDFQLVSRALSHMKFEYVGHNVPNLGTGYKPHSPRSESCEKKQLAVQNFQTGVVTVSRDLLFYISPLEGALFKLHEAYLNVAYQKLGHLPNDEEFVQMESYARDHVRSLVFEDSQAFLSATYDLKLLPKDWNSISVSCQNVQGATDQKDLNMTMRWERLSSQSELGVGYVTIQDKQGNTIFSITSKNNQDPSQFLETEGGSAQLNDGRSLVIVRFAGLGIVNLTRDNEFVQTYNTNTLLRLSKGDNNIWLQYNPNLVGSGSVGVFDYSQVMKNSHNYHGHYEQYDWSNGTDCRVKIK